MKMILTLHSKKDRLCIQSYGYEDIAKNAHWGRGCRDIYILHYVLSGEGYFNGQKVKAGQGFLITPQLLHEYHSSEDKPWRYFWVTFEGDLAEEICKNHINTDKNGIFDFNFKSELLSLSDSILAEVNPISGARALGYFFMLMSYHEEKTEFCGNYYVQKAEKYMKENFYRRLTVTEIADNLGINDRYLYNLFVKHRGVSPKKHLNTLKLNRAIQMLKTDRYSISEIAVSCGFDDVFSFSKFFSRHIGMSPTDYKRHSRRKE